MSTPYLSIYTGAEVDEGITRAYAAKEAIDLTYSGLWDLAPSDGISGAVEGLSLSFFPTNVQLTVEIPHGGIPIFANYIHGTVSPNGFQFKLSEVPNGIHYRLHYTLKGDGTGADSSG